MNKYKIHYDYLTDKGVIESNFIILFGLDVNDAESQLYRETDSFIIEITQTLRID